MTSSDENNSFGMITTSKELAINLAMITTQIREKIKTIYHTEESNGLLHRIHQNIRNSYRNNHTVNFFADMFAQTITYGLFALKTTTTGKFDILNDSNSLIKAIPVLRDFINEITEPENKTTSKHYFDELHIKELLNLLNNIDMKEINKSFRQKKHTKKTTDYIIHFYEEFLYHYNPKKKLESCVFYTPDVVVSYIIRSIHVLLQLKFGCKDGIIDESCTKVNNKFPFEIKFLDPAAGTGTFIAHIIDESHRLFEEKHNSLDKESIQQKWNEYVHHNLLKRIFGFELLLTPFIISHLKLKMKLQETGYVMQDNDQLGVFLTNTLVGIQGLDAFLDLKDNFSGSLNGQTSFANKIKFDYPIPIILGNPPYSGHSGTESEWMNDLLHGKNVDETPQFNYFEVDGQALDEKNPKWLNDDYVKFIRFAQWRIEKTGYGIVAFITNHGFLSNPTFRGMRQQLMKSFNEIYILDLHGNIRSKEKSPDGVKDENIFDIQQGVCITIFIKNPRKNDKTHIHRSDLWGSRDEKFVFLKENDISTIEWKKVESFSPWYMYYPLHMEQWDKYKLGWSIPDIFSSYSVGIMTGLDNLTIKDTPQEVQKVVEDFIWLSKSNFMMKYDLPKERRQWSYSKAKKDLLASGLSSSTDKIQISKKIKKMIVPILYRPFDTRFTFFTGRSRGFHERPRGTIMNHILKGKNLGLIVSRNSKPSTWRDVLITENIIELGVIATRPGNNAPLFPLYLFEETDLGIQRTINFTQDFRKFIQEMQKMYKSDKEIKPEKLLYYMYAILHSINYRENFEEFLKIDYPRIPFTNNKGLFDDLVKIGKRLINLHLMAPNFIEGEFKENQIQITRLNNSPIVKRIQYLNDDCLYINNDTFFKGISKNVFEFRIGSYKVCQKWFKRHRGEVLKERGIQEFMKVATIIDKTLEFMSDIDDLINKHGGWDFSFLH